MPLMLRQPGKHRLGVSPVGRRRPLRGGAFSPRGVHLGQTLVDGLAVKPGHDRDTVPDVLRRPAERRETITVLPHTGEPEPPWNRYTELGCSATHSCGVAFQLRAGTGHLAR
jgi:hypothetical protein